MFGHWWKRLRTGARRATSTGSGATDVGPTWGHLIHAGKRSNAAQENTRPVRNQGKKEAHYEIPAHQTRQRGPDREPRVEGGPPRPTRSPRPDQSSSREGPSRPTSRSHQDQGLRPGGSASPDQVSGSRPGLQVGKIRSARLGILDFNASPRASHNTGN